MSVLILFWFNYGLCQIEKAIAIIRGLRAVSDFEGEFQMALLNKELNREVETIFFMTDIKYAYLSSSAVKEVAQFGEI